MNVQPTKLAVLITCYNQENIIYETINSLANQSLDRCYYHIYISDDQSTDKSLEILNKLAMQYDNITVLTNPNKKCVGANRNNLIKNFEEDYAVFVDGDDPQNYNYLFDIYQQLDDHDIYYIDKFKEIWSDKEVEKNALKYDNLMFKIYKKNILKEIHIDENMSIGEDVEIAYKNYDLLHENSKIIHAMYYLNRRDDNVSLTKNADFLKRYQLELILYNKIKPFANNKELLNKLNNKKVELIQLAVLANQPVNEEKIDLQLLSPKFFASYMLYQICKMLHCKKFYYQFLMKKIGYKI